MLRPALQDLMDRTPGPDVLLPVRRAAESVPGVLATEKLFVRRSGMGYRVTIHVQADGEMSLRDSHVLSGAVKAAIRPGVPQTQYVVVHMEPLDGRLLAAWLLGCCRVAKRPSDYLPIVIATEDDAIDPSAAIVRHVQRTIGSLRQTDWTMPRASR